MFHDATHLCVRGDTFSTRLPMEFAMTRVVALLALTAACGTSQPPADPAPAPAPEAPAKAEAPAKEDVSKYAALFGTIGKAEVAEADQAKVDLGRMLYYDTRLSLSREISCNSCHQLDNFGVDSEPTSPGHKGHRGNRNSPTSYNAFGHVAQFWDGRAADVEAQAKGPVLAAGEMAMPDEATVEKVLASVPGYVEAFGKAFPGDNPVSYQHMADAIGAFERHLSTPSRFDDWLNGQADAMSAEEKAGLDAFVDAGCASCHSQSLFGGHMYQKLGLVEAYETSDMGRFAVTNNEADKFVFKVPSLRNVTKTGPWLHDGSVATIEDMVRLMGKHQLGKELDDATTASIVTFLGALEGRVDQAYIAVPTLPEDGPETASFYQTM